MSVAATPAATVDIAESNCSSACVAGFVIGVVGAAVLLLGIMYLSMVAYNRLTRETWLDADACPPEQSMPQPMQQSMPQPTVCEVQPLRCEEHDGGVPDATRAAEKVEPDTDACRPEQPQPLQPAYDLQPLQEPDGVDGEKGGEGEVECEEDEEGDELECEEDTEEDADVEAALGEAEAALRDAKAAASDSTALGPEESEVLPHYLFSEK